MSVLSPGWLLLGALAVPIILLYMLRLRRREVRVSSTLLWHMVVQDRQANTPWQRLKRNLLLFLQLLILAALVFALARPYASLPVVASGSVVVLLDASASMSASDVSPSRFEAARRAAHGLIDGLENDALMTVIQVGRQPSILAAQESDKSRLHQALDTAQHNPGAADWEAAFALAAGASRGSDEAATTVVVSDGGLPAEGLPPLPGEIRYLSIGQSGENLALSALALRQSASGAELFASVANYGEADRSVILSLYRDGQLLSAQPLHVPAGGRATLVQSGLPDRRASYEARLSPEEADQGQLDLLKTDDQAFAVYRPQAAGRTLLVSEGNFFLEQLLAALEDISPYRSAPTDDGEPSLPQGPFDLYVFDGTFPEELPPGNLLLINPPENPLFEVQGTLTDFSQVEVHDHPLTRFVRWDEVHLRQARLILPPGWAESLVTTSAGPLVFVGETGGRRVAVVAFDLHDSDLPLQVSFPILFSNLIGYLNPSLPFDAPQGLRIGESLAIRPEIGADEVRVVSPSGELTPLEISESGATFSATWEPGIYALEVGSEPDLRIHYFAVNSFSQQESDIAPAQAIHVGRKDIPSSSQAEVGQREFWPWLAGLGLLALLAEWWVYHQRQLPPEFWKRRFKIRGPKSA